MIKDIIFGISNKANMNNTYYIGQTLQLNSGYTVTVRKIVTKRLLRVSWGFNRNGNDIIGIIDTTIHLIK